MAAPTCVICCEPLNKSTRKPVTCACEHTACAACTRRYLLESPNEPDCMSCHRRWTIPMLNEKLPKTFVDGPLLARRTEMLVDREKSRLPATQPYAALLKHTLLRPTEDAVLLSLRARIEGRSNFRDIVRNMSGKEVYELRRLVKFVAYLSEQEVHAQLSLYEAMPVGSRFVGRCPAEGCRGFVSSGTWRCGMCETLVCERCREVKAAPSGADAPHLCDPAAVATAELLEKDSRPCPKCAAMIYRIDGCSHMFCTACRTPFHWNTGEIMTFNTNPLYYEWRRQSVEAARRAPPAAESSAPVCDTIEERYASLRRIRVPYTTRLREMLGIPNGRVTDDRIVMLPGLISHNRQVMTELERRALSWRPRFQSDYWEPRVPQEDPHRPIRLSYLLGMCGDASFKKELQEHERKVVASREFTEVYEMYNLTLCDFAKRAHQEPSVDGLAKLRREMSELRDYANDTLVALGRAHGVKPTLIDKKAYIIIL